MLAPLAHLPDTAGAASSVETVLLFTMEEAMTGTKAGQVQRSYKPPTAV
jgi:hypothetical protein